MPRRLLLLITFSLFFLLVQCSSDYAPDCSVYGPDKSPSEDIILADAKQAWTILADKKKESQWPQAMEAYNKALYTLIERMRCLDRSGKMGNIETYPFAISNAWRDRFQDHRFYDKIIPADQIKIKRLNESFIVYGVGIPLIGIANREKSRSIQNQISDAEGIHTLTAVLDFNVKKGERPILSLISRLNHDKLLIGKQRHNLAANFSAPLDYLWELSKVDDEKLIGLFRPSDSFDTLGLSFQEPYDPNKIPVVFTHGLQSSPATFANLTNRLLSAPEIRKNYQFWFYGYPTGISWVFSSEHFRKSINQAREKFDPNHKHKAFDQMVLVGHSMGGLITRYSISEEPWKILKYTFKESEREHLSPEFLTKTAARNRTIPHYEKFQSQFNFSPIPYANRAIFLATPHKGSDFADNWLARLGIALIELPQNIIEETYRIVTLNNNILILNPDKLVDDLTSIGQLSPENVFIQGLEPLRPQDKIPVHSIIGDRGDGDTPDSSDGFVKYKSSHLDWSQSEKIVPANHSVQDNPETATEVHRILTEHLKKHRGKKAFQFPLGRPAPAECTPANSSIWSKLTKELFDPGTNFLPMPG